MFADEISQVQQMYRDGFGLLGTFLWWVVFGGCVLAVLLGWHMFASGTKIPKPRPFDPEKDRKHDE